MSDDELDAIEFGDAGGLFHIVWGRDDVAHFPDAGNQPRWREPSPPPGGCRVTFFELPPGDDNDLDEYVVNAMSEFADPSRPGMHSTPTLDFDIVLNGTVGLELEEGEVVLGPGDVVVLNGTLHRWHNRGSTTATMAVVVLGAQHDAFPGIAQLRARTRLAIWMPSRRPLTRTYSAVWVTGGSAFGRDRTPAIAVDRAHHAL